MMQAPVTYRGDAQTRRITIDDGVHPRWGSRPLPHVVYHSPTGMEWGYAGSGPSDLALSMLAHHYGFEPAEMPTSVEIMDLERDARRTLVWAMYQSFKTDVIARLAGDQDWAITTDQISEWVASGVVVF